ncbi:hypothetical protein GW915_11325 [bacterium]|nr:hypothetical protein [bacterium]
MFKPVTGFIFACLISLSATANQIHISAEFRAFSDASFPNVIDSLDPDWTVSTDEKDRPIYLLEKIILKSELPYVSRLGDAFLSINESGVLILGLQHAEKLGEVYTSFQIPQVGGRLLPNEVPYVLQTIGGDYASQAWNFAGRVSLKVD